MLDHVVGAICAHAARHMSLWLQVSSRDDVKSSPVGAACVSPGPTHGSLAELLASNVCACLFVCVIMMENVFQMTARGMSHLLSVAFTPPPVCLCACVMRVRTQRLTSPHFLLCVCVCVCSPLHPDQAIPEAINAHDSMCDLSYLIHYQLPH